MSQRLHYTLIGLFLLASGCALTPADHKPEKAVAAENKSAPLRALPEDSVYDLLLAELSLRNHDLNTALGNYRRQADRTGDLELIASTARLADYMEQHNVAAVYAQRWLKRDADASEAHYILAGALSRLGDPLSGLPHMIRVLELGDETNFAAMAATALGRPDAEKNAFFEALQTVQSQHPSDNSLRIALALMLQYRQREEDALELVRLALDEEPTNPHALLIETRTLSQLGRDDEAIERLKYAVDQNPRHKRLRHDLCRKLVKVDVYQAKAHYEVLARQYPQDHDILLELMLINRELSNTEEAEQQLESLSANPQQRSRAHYVLGRLAEEERDWSDALQHYQQATRLPEFNEASRRVASISLSTEGREQALSRLADWRESLPEHAEFIYLLEAEILRKADLDERGFSLLTQGLQTLPDSTELRYARSLFSERLGNLPAVEKDLRYIIDRDPNNSAALNALGYTLANRSARLDEAQRLIERALKLSPDDPAILDSYGWVLLLKGKTEAALSYLERAFAQSQDHEIAAHLGEAYWLLGREDAARAAWQKGLQDTPNSPIIYDTLQRLKLLDE
ncbi:tetratricopeptide repeat protein [Spongiibacter sp. UBA1325]|jgi:tetratricopeptide (TPR) repeat protein|uniref:tetratricopeptide repeat protein n=1 Tax=Spongiibacter sp. UBA1325 TaxID=1947543 RepID=UPI00257CDEBD|nr:tetratricopeptide repeat protein [Spongiibacter sp. UBA1325]|tara:strand:- start:270 stop:1982 length:1713 start_codon:yes stop_codon:yes gene_type:complete